MSPTRPLPKGAQPGGHGSAGEVVSAASTSQGATGETLDQSFLAPGGGLVGPLVEAMRQSAGVDTGGGLGPGDTLGGHIELRKLLGQGGMGAVYEGFDALLQRPVAVKTIKAENRFSPRAKARFLREARVLSQLDHPGICRIHNLIEEGEADYLVLELIDGENLAQAAPGLSVDQKLRVALGVAEALEAAHRAEIVHRDLKPENIMVTRSGVAKVLDFGISRSLSSAALPSEGSPQGVHQTAVGTLVGTVRYMSPEQADGQRLTEATDLYSFGIVLQELMTDLPAYEGSDFKELLAQAREGRARPMIGVDRDVVELIQGLLRLSPEARPSAAQAAAALRRILERPERRRRRRGKVAAGLGVALALGITGWWSYRSAQPEVLLTQGGRVLLLPLVNDTGDAELDWIEQGLRELVAGTLASVEELDLVPQEQLDRLIKERSVDALNEDSGRWGELASLVGADVVVGAHLSRRDNSVRKDPLRVTYRLVRPGERETSRTLRVDEVGRVADALAQRLTLHLAPNSLRPKVEEQFSADPLLNQIYALGAHRLRQEGTQTCAYFEVCVDRDPGFLRAWDLKAQCDYLAGRREPAEAAWLEIVERAEATGETRLRGKTLSKLGTLSLESGDFESAGRFFDAALAQAEATPDAAEIGAGYRQLAGLRFYQGRSKEALELAERSLELQRQLDNPMDLAQALHTAGVLYGQMDEPERGAELLFQAIELEQELELPFLMMSTLNSLGSILVQLDRHDEGIAMLETALASARQLGSINTEGMVLVNLGDTHFEQGRLEEALSFFRQSLELFEEAEHELAQSIVALNLASALGLLERFDEGRPYLVRAQENLQPEDVSLLLVEGMYHLADGEARQALKKLEQGRAQVSDSAWEAPEQELLERARAAVGELDAKTAARR